MCLYWRDLVRLYPRAKVLLTVRDPVKWYESVRNTVKAKMNFMSHSWLALPLRVFNALRGRYISLTYLNIYDTAS